MHHASNDARQLFSQILLDHQAQMASILKILSEHASSELESSGHTVASQGMRQVNTRDNLSYTIAMTASEQSRTDADKRAIEDARERIISEFGSRSNILAILERRGVK